ncbi:hypothetical protein Tco_0892346 [Tanacetum coccineum]|uniref:Uncharacterized protein n=1 Tax=Tanacetum coccineum TaxID=301880 RepID=A0ABQ5CB09_9ASTR
MMSLEVGKLKDEVICTLARQLTEVAAMAYVLRFATLLSLYVGVLSLPAQRKSSRLWQWDQVLAQNVPHGSIYSVSDIVDTFFKKSHPGHYLCHKVVLSAFNDTAHYPDQGGDNKKDMLQKAIVQPVSTSDVNVGVAVHPISDGLNELTRSSEEGTGAEKGVSELPTTAEQHPRATDIIRNPGMIDCTCDEEDEEENRDEGGRLSQSGKELKKLLGTNNGGNESEP